MKFSPFLILLLSGTGLAAAPDDGLPAQKAPLRQKRELRDVLTWCYHLQNDEGDLSAHLSSPFDLFVLDYSRDGSEDGRYTQEEIAELKEAEGRRRFVLAYLSIGEAEDYRYYWEDEWWESPPSWLGPENPEWPGNYTVRYWEVGWQNIVREYLEQILAAGFDGVYLDRIDAYEFWEEENPRAAEDMVSLVRLIRQWGEEEKGGKTHYSSF